ncbi:putative gustatory receptor 2a [Eurosta solidaginis]|uniref:putative gustatory receptor 2a n=1 Tax=Eurosta solidaginis TaxID=178769 RepID=UPI003530FB80
MPYMDISESIDFMRRPLQIGALPSTKVDYKKSNLLEYYIFCTLFAPIAILFYGVFGKNRLQLTASAIGGIGDLIDLLQFTGIRLAHIVTLLEAFLHRRKISAFFIRVREIDDIFERSLNVDIDNRCFNKQLIRRAIKMISAYVCVQILVVSTESFSEHNSLSICFILYMLSFCVTMLRYFQFTICIMIIRERLKKLVLILDEQKLYEDVHIIDLTRLHIIRDLYNRLWELTAHVNRNFGFSLLTNVGNDLLAIISNSYWIFIKFNNYSNTMEQLLQSTSNALLSLPHMFNVLSLALLCEETLQKTTEIAYGLDNMETCMPNNHQYNIVFSLQLLHQKITFSAAGSFNINCGLLYSIAGATTTYLIILIQFQMSGDRFT